MLWSFACLTEHQKWIVYYFHCDSEDAGILRLINFEWLFVFLSWSKKLEEADKNVKKCAFNLFKGKVKISMYEMIFDWIKIMC